MFISGKSSQQRADDVRACLNKLKSNINKSQLNLFQFLPKNTKCNKSELPKTQNNINKTPQSSFIWFFRISKVKTQCRIPALLNLYLNEYQSTIQRPMEGNPN